MIMNSHKIHIHRFRDSISLECENPDADNGYDCVDLSAEMAIMLAKALIDAAFDIKTNGFRESKFIKTQLTSSEATV